MTALTEEDVIWITNDDAELGVRIGNQCFFLYKGDSITYDDKMRENGTPMMIRTVGKREFGECAHPLNHGDYTKKGTVSLGDSDRWEEMPGQQRVDVQKSADDLKARQLDQAETVEQLKDWLREYLP